MSFLIVSVSQEHASSIIPDVVLPHIDQSSHEDGYAGLERSLAALSIGRPCAACDVCGLIRAVSTLKSIVLEPPDYRTLWAMAKLTGDDTETHDGPLLTG